MMMCTASVMKQIVSYGIIKICCHLLPPSRNVSLFRELVSSLKRLTFWDGGSIFYVWVFLIKKLGA
jgi:hypothetical protein